MFPRCMGAKAAAEHRGVATGFTGIGVRWRVLVIGQLRKCPNLLGCCSRRRRERPWVPLVVLPDETH